MKPYGDSFILNLGLRQELKTAVREWIVAHVPQVQAHTIDAETEKALTLALYHLTGTLDNFQERKWRGEYHVWPEGTDYPSV